MKLTFFHNHHLLCHYYQVLSEISNRSLFHVLYFNSVKKVWMFHDRK